MNKYIARAGVCSRRKADALIDQQRVKVNGEVITSYWQRVGPGDVVEVNGRLISPRKAEYILVNKPKNVITTTDDERGRRTVMDLVDDQDKEPMGLFPVGRLDRDTVGALLLTNDGELAHRLMHPRYEVNKLYVIRTKEAVKPHEIDQLRHGIQLEDGLAKADNVAFREGHSRREIGLQLHEGRNRQVRRMMEALGHEVVFLERINYAGLTTDGIRRGKWRRLASHEIRRLRKLVKLK
ncbi:MAG: pseudouridine synthase [Rhodothermales bacterium]